MDFYSAQERIRAWVIRTFGGACYWDLRERAQRVSEEALELAQAQGLTKDDVQRILDRVYSRPVGDPKQEAAGLMVCLLAYSQSAFIDLEAVTYAEILRVESKTPEHFRQKQTEKALAGTARLPSQP